MKTNIKWRLSSQGQYIGSVGSLELFAIEQLSEAEYSYDLNALLTLSFQSALYEDVNSRMAATRCYHFKFTELDTVKDAAERVFVEYIERLTE